MRASRFLLPIAFVAFVGLGLPDGLLGTGWPAIRADFGREVGDLGTLVVAGIIGFGTAAAVSGRVAARVGSGGLLIAAYAGVATGLAMIISVDHWVLLLAGMAVLGAGNGLLDPGINAHVARQHGARTMNFLHASFGIGATLGPLVMVRASSDWGDWRYAYGILLGYSALMLVGILGTRRRWDEVTDSSPEEPASSAPRLRSAALLMTTFALATGVEVATGQWAFTVLSDHRRLPASTAAWFVSAFWAGMTGGRLAGAAFGHRWSIRTVLRWSVGLVAAALVWAGTIDGIPGAWGYVAAGVGMALVFPTLVLITHDRHQQAAARVLGWGFSAAAIGAAVTPWVLGRVADTAGIGSVAVGLAAAGAALVVAAEVLLRRVSS